MKKKYIAPTTNLEHLFQQQMICSSPGLIPFAPGEIEGPVD